MTAQSPNPKSQITKETTKSAKAAKTAKNLKQTIMIFARFAIFAVFAVQASAQQLLDHVVARIGNSALTQTDVDFAAAFGVVDPKAGDPVKQMIDRRLVIGEVNRFPPPEPTATAIDEVVARMKTTAGSQAAAVMKRTGVDEKRLSEFARETLRIEAYIAQRFGNGPRADQQRTQWLDGLRSRGDVTEFSLRP